MVCFHLAKMACTPKLRLGVTERGPLMEAGVHKAPKGRLLSWDAVVVVMLGGLLILTPGRILCPHGPGWKHKAQDGTLLHFQLVCCAIAPTDGQRVVLQLPTQQGAGQGSQGTN